MNTDPSIPAAKIRMIKASMDCHYFGLAGVIPFLGPFFGLVAALESGRARVYETKLWNPARTHRLVGLGCALLGLLIWVPVDLRIAWGIINSVAQSGN